MDEANTAQLQRLRKRKDFLAARNGVRVHTRSFSLQVRKRSTVEEQQNHENAPRVGFTVTKKNGNAVVRNRIRRRLREMVRLNSNTCVQRNHDYVLIAREAALHSPFSSLTEEFRNCVKTASRKLGTKRPVNQKSHIRT